MKVTSISCDCGCGEVATGEHGGSKNWISLASTEGFQRGSDLTPKLQRELNFSGVTCLHRWTEKAVRAIPGLQKAATGLHPRGSLVNKDVPGLYV